MKKVNLNVDTPVAREIFNYLATESLPLIERFDHAWGYADRFYQENYAALGLEDKKALKEQIESFSFFSLDNYSFEDSFAEPEKAVLITRLSFLRDQTLSNVSRDIRFLNAESELHGNSDLSNQP